MGSIDFPQMNKTQNFDIEHTPYPSLISSDGVTSHDGRDIIHGESMEQLCQLALQKYNQDKEVKVELLKVLEAKTSIVSGNLIFLITFLVKDSAGSYQAQVRKVSDSKPVVEFCCPKPDGLQAQVAAEQFCSRKDITEEAKKQARLSLPLIAVSLLQYSFQIVALMFVGHRGELALSGASMATSFASVTGYSVLLGMASALETLCGQAYGANQHHMLGVHTQRAMLTLFALSIPLSVIWFYTTTILIAFHQNHEISVEAGIFIRWMIPSLFAYSLLQCLNRFLQTQKKVFPMMACAGITAVLHIIACWVLVIKCQLGSKGAALAISVSNWVNVVLMALYVMYSGTCTNTWTGFSKQALVGTYSFIKLGVPSTFMICLEYWSFEMVVLLSGLLPNPKLQTSVLSISLNTCWMVYTISVGLGGAISTRVANELGAGNKKGALLALRVMIGIALCEGTLVAVTTILVRDVWGKLYTHEAEVIRYLSKMMLLLALSNFLDGFQCVLSGAARGCGWQKVCSVINLFAYYAVGIPCSVLLAFRFHLGGMGLWAGIICGLSVQNVALVVLNVFTNWDKVAIKASRRAQETLSSTRS